MATAGVIDFRCSQCGKLLRVGSDAAGRQARCPQCGHVQVVPASSEVAASGNPFATAQPPVPPAGGEVSNPYAATDYDTRIGGYAQAGPITPTRIDPGDVISQTWAIYKSNVMPLVGVVVAMMGMGVSLSFIMMPLSIVANSRGNPALSAAVSVGMNIVMQLFSIWLQLGAAVFTLKLVRGNPWSFGDLFRGAPYLLSYLAAALLIILAFFLIALPILVPGLALLGALGTQSPVAWVALGLGLIAFICVAIFIGFMLMPLQFVIVDRGLGPMEALAACRDITRGNKVSLFLLMLFSMLVALLGLLALCVGWLFALAFVFPMFAVAYLLMSGQRTAASLYGGAPAMA